METIVILDNIRSVHNVGSILRTCDGFGVTTLYMCGITPYPILDNDLRLPHIRTKIQAQLHKTALGAEESMNVRYFDSTLEAIKTATDSGYTILGLEQDKRSVALNMFDTKGSFALVLGREVEGLDLKTRDMCDYLLEIEMKGTKESFNVSVAAGIALYQLCGTKN